MTELIFFDCDGVLVDSEPLAAGVTAELFTEIGIAMTRDEALGLYTGASREAAARITAERYGLCLTPRFDADHADRLHRRFETDLRPVGGMPELLRMLALPCCVTSNSGLQRLAVSLTATGLLPFFGRNVFSAEEVARGKPAPDLFHFAARAFATDIARCAVIDDSVSGIAGAVAAGARAIGFVGGSHLGTARDRAAQAARLRAAGAEAVAGHAADLPALLLSRSTGPRPLRPLPTGVVQ